MTNINDSAKCLTFLLSCLIFFGSAAFGKELSNNKAQLQVMFDRPAGWKEKQNGDITIFTAPEKDAFIAIVSVTKADSAASAAEKAWKQHKPDFSRLLRTDAPAVTKNGWSSMREISYETSPKEKLYIWANVFELNGYWQVALFEGSYSTVSKRSAAISKFEDSFAVEGYRPQTLEANEAKQLTAESIKKLKEFVNESATKLDILGVGFALVENGKVIYEGGVGVRVVGSPEPVDKNTLFQVASNTKGMTTLLLAKLVEMKKLGWDDQVVKHYPDFKLGDKATTDSVKIRHLVCACTGLPREDIRWIFGNSLDTPASDIFSHLASTSPTSGFGEMYQYSNQMAAAAGFIAGHVLYPDLELGQAYDKAMQEYIFTPLGMTDTTLSMPHALSSENHARPHSTSLLDENSVVEQSANTGINHVINAYRPAGGAWVSPHDLIKYVANELSGGLGFNGKRLFSEKPLLERRIPFVTMGKDKRYGMGLIIEDMSGIPIIRHGGSMIGYKSDIIMIPGANVGAVIMTNSDDGYSLAKPFGRRIIELIYDGDELAEQQVDVAVQQRATYVAKIRDELSEPVNQDIIKTLAVNYLNDDLGFIKVGTQDGKPVISNGTWQSTFTTKTNPDQTVSINLTGPGLLGVPLIIGEQNGKKTLTIQDNQVQYVYVESEI